MIFNEEYPDISMEEIVFHHFGIYLCCSAQAGNSGCGAMAFIQRFEMVRRNLYFDSS